MNFIPQKSEPNGNYLCTWALQGSAAKKLGIKGNGCADQRDALNTELLFGREDLYHVYSDEFRGGLYLLLDDGWDVPYGTEHLPNSSIEMFGTVAPDPVKFKDLSNNAEERLKEMSRRVKAMGYAGLGLWISPQQPFVNQSELIDMAAAREYWEEKARISEAAGVAYWKVDWGAQSGKADYRIMMTECVRKYAPNLVIEHAVPLSPYQEVNPQDDKVKRMRKLLPYSDYFRTYDIQLPFEDSATLNRVHCLLADNDDDMMCGSLGKVNIETCAYLAAALGFNLGIMRHNRETEAALRWQRIAPPFSVSEGKYIYSKEILTDNLYLEYSRISWLPEAANKTYNMSAPAVMVRNTVLPYVETKGSDKPFITASLNPKTGAYSIAAVRRNIDPNHMIIVPAKVTCYPESIDAPIGVFGVFDKLILSFKEDIHEGAKVYAQCLLKNEAADITDRVQINGNTLMVDGKDIRYFGKDKHDYTETFDPAVLIKII